jgi:hypothetical protein
MLELPGVHETNFTYRLPEPAGLRSPAMWSCERWVEKCLCGFLKSPFSVSSHFPVTPSFLPNMNDMAEV